MIRIYVLCSFLCALVNFNCQLDTAYSRLRREFKLKDCPDQIGWWASICGITLTDELGGSTMGGTIP